jgi:hypothetical protein
MTRSLRRADSSFFKNVDICARDTMFMIQSSREGAVFQLQTFGPDRLSTCHGFVELHFEERWVKATLVFNAELCRIHGVSPLEFDGRHDALFQACNSELKICGIRGGSGKL